MTLSRRHFLAAAASTTANQMELEYPFMALLLQRNPHYKFRHTDVRNASQPTPCRPAQSSACTKPRTANGRRKNTPNSALQTKSVAICSSFAAPNSYAGPTHLAILES